MFGMMQEKPQSSIRHIQATGRSALKLDTKTSHGLYGHAHALSRANRQRRVNYAASGAIIATASCWARKLASSKNHSRRDVVSREKKEKLHNAPNTSIQELGIFVMTGKIWKYQNKGATDETDKLGRNCKCCGNGNGYVVCL